MRATLKTDVTVIDKSVMQACLQEVCESLLKVDFQVVSGLKQGIPLLTSGISLVDTRDQNNYLLLVNCDNRMLDKVAENIFGAMVDDIDMDDMLSALTELTNLVGGEIIKVLERDCRLGLPFIVSTTGDITEITTEKVLETVTLAHEELFINVVLTRL